jgi:aspartate kinase
VSVTIDNTQFLDQITKELQPLGELEVKTGQTIVSVVGNKLTEDNELMSKMFTALTAITINMVSFGGSNHNISILVETEQRNATLKALNQGLFGLE